MTEAIAAFGTKLSKAPNTPIAELTNISGPSLSADAIDVTSHDSQEGFREFVGGLKDGGEVSIDGNFVNDAGQAALIADLGTKQQYTIELPTTPPLTWAFDAVVTGFEMAAPLEDKLTFSASLKISGKPVLS